MPCTLNPPSESKKIRLHSPFLHAWLPQMLLKVQYARRSKMLPSRSASQDSSESVKTGPLTSLVSTSLTQTNPLPANSTTPTKKIYRHPYQQFHVLIPPFKHHHSVVPDTPSHSPTMSLQTKPSSPPSLEVITTSAVVARTSNRLKRLSESGAPFKIKGHPVKMKRLQHSSRDSTKFDDSDLNLSCLPLRHQHPLTLPS